MASDTKSCKVWVRFETKKMDRNIKFRIQDLPKDRMQDFVTFLTTHYIRDEAFHKTAGVYNSQEAIEEYKQFLTRRYEQNPAQIAVCCLDSESDDFDEILAVSIVQLVPLKTSKENSLSQLQNKEIQTVFNIISVVTKRFPQSLKEKYESYYNGRGIIVHPDYRGLGIASQIIKQRRLLCKENKVPMTCAWMTSIGSQKAAERDGWETVAEVDLKELDTLTGLTFVKDVPTYKLMMATVN